MQDRKELQRQFMETPKHAGIYLITNTVSGKVLLGSSTNLHGPLNRHRFMLSINGHRNGALQSDWNQLGESSFKLEIVDSIKRRDDDPTFNLEDELSLLEQIWIEKIQPFSGATYNQGARIRE